VENTQRITIMSMRLKKTCTVLIYCLPLVSGLFWFFFNWLYARVPMIPLPVRLDHEVDGITRLFAFLADMIPVSVVIFGLFRLRILFSLYEKALIFTEQNVDCFRSLGRALILWAVCDVIRTSLLSVILTLQNPPGQRMITVSFDSGEFTGVFVGIVVLIISWVMDEGRKIEEEQALIV